MFRARVNLPVYQRTLGWNAMQKSLKVPILARIEDAFLELNSAIEQFHKWRTSLANDSPSSKVPNSPTID